MTVVLCVSGLAGYGIGNKPGWTCQLLADNLMIKNARPAKKFVITERIAVNANQTLKAHERQELSLSFTLKLDRELIFSKWQSIS